MLIDTKLDLINFVFTIIKRYKVVDSLRLSMTLIHSNVYNFYNCFFSFQNFIRYLANITVHNIIIKIIFILAIYYL